MIEPASATRARRLDDAARSSRRREPGGAPRQPHRHDHRRLAAIGEKLDTGEPIRAGGILILSRTRGAQTDAINRALKSHGIPIAGADRLALTEHIAVMDLIALGRVMLLPEDDLSLAAVLKSPLIGLGEEELYALAHGRRRSGTRSGGRATAAREARARLEAWRSLADRRSARLLRPHSRAGEGRRRILMRLGAEAEDVLDEFLAQALAYEKSAFRRWRASSTGSTRPRPTSSATPKRSATRSA